MCVPIPLARPLVRAAWPGVSAGVVFGLALSLACWAGGGCKKNGNQSGGGGGGNKILIGHYGSLTGSEATFGKSTSRGIQLAIKEINASGGVKGRQVELKEYDDKGDAKETGSVVTRLVTNDKVSAVIGEVASGLSLA